MRRPGLSLSLACLIFIPPAARSESNPANADAKKMSGLVSQLGSRLFKEREDAALQLRGLGAGALEALRSAVRSSDPEIRRRAERLSNLIQHQLETQEMLRPKLVRLKWDKVPVSQAIAEFSRKTGLSVEHDHLALEEVISLDTGEVTVWEALEKLCAKAGLIERPAPLEETSSVRIVNRPGGQQVVMVMSSPTMASGQRRVDTVLVGKGTATNLPTYRAGGVRIRALPIDDTSPWFQRQPQKETLALLEVSPQPKMGWQSVLDVQIERAIDETHQSLLPVSDLEGAREVMLGRFPGQRAVIMPDGMQRILDPRILPLRFQRGEHTSHVLKEVSGQISALLLSPLEPIFTVGDILQAQGRVIQGSHGESLKIANVKKTDAGSIRLGLELTDAALAWNPPVRVGRRFVQANGMVVNRAGFQLGRQGEEQHLLSLYDRQGRAFDKEGSQTSASVTANGGLTYFFDALFFHAGDDREQPAKFVFSARRYLTVEIPFKLKDVPVR